MALESPLTHAYLPRPLPPTVSPQAHPHPHCLTPPHVPGRQEDRDQSPNKRARIHREDEVLSESECEDDAVDPFGAFDDFKEDDTALLRELAHGAQGEAARAIEASTARRERTHIAQVALVYLYRGEGQGTFNEDTLAAVLDGVLGKDTMEMACISSEHIKTVAWAMTGTDKRRRRKRFSTPRRSSYAGSRCTTPGAPCHPRPNSPAPRPPAPSLAPPSAGTRPAAHCHPVGHP